MIGWWVMLPLSSNSRINLLHIARETLENCVRNVETPLFNPPDPLLWEIQPCFVTLKKDGKLRGCIGMLEAERPLFEEVVRVTKAAAFEDYRFNPVQPDELQGIEIEISILSPFERIYHPSEITVGLHGVCLRSQDRKGILLPEVAQEMGWSPDEFVKICAEEKVGLNFQKLGDFELYRFTTEKIKEKTS